MGVGTALETLVCHQITATGGCTGQGGPWLGLARWQGSWQLVAPWQSQSSSLGADGEFSLSGLGWKMLSKSWGRASSLLTLSGCWCERADIRASSAGVTLLAGAR